MKKVTSPPPVAHPSHESVLDTPRVCVSRYSPDVLCTEYIGVQFYEGLSVARRRGSPPLLTTCNPMVAYGEPYPDTQ
jgi:hypothetical protein